MISIVINSIPKSGTKLARNFIREVFPSLERARWVHIRAWNGTSEERLVTLNDEIGREPAIYTTHCPYHRIIDNAIPWMLFVYRHPLDVAISLTHHIREREYHVNYADFTGLDDDQALMLAITGMGDDESVSPGNLPSIVKTYQMFEGWLIESTAQGLSFEQMVTCDLPDMFKENEQEMRAALGNERFKRRGAINGWMDTCKPEHISAFKDLGGNELLKLWGYDEVG